MAEIELLRSWWVLTRARLEVARAADPDHGERGMTTETVIITAVLAALALAVGAIIVAKVTAKANSIPTD
ncbi:MAG: hypothetical protein ACRDZ1_08780 [Acidimicrobiia bacterium]